MKLAVGAAFDLPAARRHGIPVGLGTDGAGSNNSLDLLADAKHLALLQKHAAADASVAPGRGGPRDRDRARARRCSAARASTPVSPPTSCSSATDRPELGLGSLAAGLVYASSGVGRRHDGRRRAGADARRVVEGVEEILARARERARAHRAALTSWNT